jgi:uncharacterized C2H2 Zn-finger protein
MNQIRAIDTGRLSPAEITEMRCDRCGQTFRNECNQRRHYCW